MNQQELNLKTKELLAIKELKEKSKDLDICNTNTAIFIDMEITRLTKIVFNGLLDKHGIDFDKWRD